MVGPDSLIGKTIHGNLFIKNKLGEGAMGTVYLAENIALREKRYAVKVLKRELTHNPSFKKRFHDEARHQAELSDPHIVQMYDYFNVGDDYFLVLEYVDGRSLDNVIDSKGGPLDEKQALTIIKGILSGLDCAHQNALLHRDVKPANVMVDKAGRPRLTDFGIARQAGVVSQIDAGKSIGTPAYMSPEQIGNPDGIDHRSDVYSVGIVLFEMLTGKLPFQGASFASIAEEQINAPVPDPRVANRKIKKGLSEIVRKAMQKNPGDRFQGCVEFRKALEAYERGRNWPLWAVCVSVLLAAGVYGYKTYKTKIDELPVIRGLVTSATDSHAMVCREGELLKRKDKGKRLAEESGNSGFADQLAKQIEEINVNMTNFVAAYANQISKLSELDHDSVQRVLSEQDEDIYRARYRQLAGKDYGQFTAGREPPTREAMLRECPS